MKRETKKVTRKATKKAAKRPARKRVRRQPDLTLDDVVRAAMKEGVKVNFVATPDIQPRKVDIHYPDVWKEELVRSAKVLGVDPLEVQAKLSEFLPKHYPNHLRILEAIVEQEKAAIATKCRPYQDAEQAAYLGGKKVQADEQKRIVDIEEKIRERREIIEPNARLSGPQRPARKDEDGTEYPGRCGSA